MQLPLLDRDFAQRSTRATPASLELYGGDHTFLRAKKPAITTAVDTITAVDLFAGAGGLTLGAQLAAEELGRHLHVPCAFEKDSAAAAVYRANIKVDVVESDVQATFSRFGLPKTIAERRMANSGIDFVLAGPPCQGHSDLNNYTRRSDARNDLYFAVARAAEILNPTHVVIENVPGAQHDRNGVVVKTITALRDLEYETATMMLDAADYGVAQRRKRYFVIASRYDLTGLRGLIESQREELRPLSWAIGDLVGQSDSGSLIDSPGATKGANLNRVRYLFDYDLHDLPNEQRPPCHAQKDHSYKSVYGRLHWDRPAQTITRGFYSVCMGRYVHPSEPRTITAHEAARIQFLPDFFDLRPAGGKSALATIVGNVVPPKLGYILARTLLQIQSHHARR